MGARMIAIAWRRTRGLGRDDSGAALLITLAVFLLLFILVSGIYAVGETIHQKIELQNAADAAAYSAAVVQSDGLSRMATVNRAMSWTYTQMTKRQLDYITYRWLRLTEQRFIEDYNNAKAYHGYMSFYKLGYWPVPTGSGMQCKSKHKREGQGWWCGLSQNRPKMLIINGRNVELAALSESLNTFGALWDGSNGDASATRYDTIDDTVGDDDEYNDSPDVPNPVEESLNRNLLQAYNDLQADQLLSGYNASMKENDPNFTDVSIENAEYKNWLDANSKLALEFSDENFLAWLQENDCAGSVDEDGISYTESDSAYQKLCLAFEQYTGIQAPREPAQEATGEEMQQYFSDTEEYARKVDAWLSSLSSRQIGYLISGEGYASSQAAGIPTTVNTAGASVPTPTPVTTAPVPPNPPPRIVNVSPNARWAGKLGELIDQDKANIELLSAILPLINHNMRESMRFAAESVLMKNLSSYDPATGRTDMEKLSDYIHHIAIPLAPDPYELNLETQEDNVAAYFSPLNNTEAHERIFLAMSDPVPRTRLYEYFRDDSAASNQQGKFSGGLEQWFIRGKGVYCDDQGRTVDQDYSSYPPGRYYPETGKSGEVSLPAGHGPIWLRRTERSEGALGIRRAYKDTNLNETGAKFLPLMITVSRGNHVMYPGFDISYEESGDLNSSYGGESHGAGRALFNQFVQEMFQAIFDKASELADVMPSSGNLRSAAPMMCKETADSVALYSEYRWASAKWWCFWKFKGFKRKWLLHVPIPKWFCGPTPRHIGDDVEAFIPISVPDMLVKFFPPLGLKEIGKPRHGYLTHTYNIKQMGEQLEFLTHVGGEFSRSRDDYESCVMMLDDPTFIIKGHARIYGDDKEIFNNRYVGVAAKPWVLNEKFFNGEGSIVVHVGRKHKNPFSILFGLTEPDRAGAETEAKGLHAIFNPPNDDGAASNYMWAASAARAGLRRTRGDHPSAPRAYIITYDDSADAENLKPVGGWLTNYPKHIKSGCVCHPDNSKTIANIWNLCEPDWDAVLLPLRYAKGGASGSEWRDVDLFSPLHPFLNTGWSHFHPAGPAEFSHPVPQAPYEAEESELKLRELLQLKIY